MEVSGKRHVESEDVNICILCDPCQLDNDQEPAVSYCTHCNEYLCDTCTRVHRKSKASRHHQLLDGDEMPKGKLKSVEDKFCSKHHKEEIKYFCRSHNVFVCSVCVTLGHVMCGVAYIEDLATGFDTSKEYTDLLKHLREIQQKLTENKLKSDKNSEAAERNYNHLISDIKKFRTEINTTLDVLEKRITEEALKIKTDDLMSMQSIATQCDEIQKNVKDVTSTLETLEKYRQNQQLVIATRKAETQVIEYKTKLDTISKQNILREVSFRREEAILKTLTSCDNLGRLEIMADTERLAERDIRLVGIEKSTKPLIPSFVKKIYIRHNEDRNDGGCWITGSVLVNGDKIGLVDNYDSSVKVVDLHTEAITCYIHLEEEPWDLTCIDPNTLVVTSDSKLTYLRYDRKLSIIKHVPMEAGCTGITYSNNKLYVTFTGDQPAVRILDTDGNILKTFITDSLGQKLFGNPRYITTSTDGQSIYVTDYDKDEVTCLNMQGHVVSTYTHNDLRGPLGVTVDDNNCIYVAGGDSHNIHRISSRCEHIQILLGQKDGVAYPRTVLYKNGMMYTNRHGYPQRFFLYIFKLQYTNT